MKTLPSHTAFVVAPKEGSDKLARWHEVGTVWAHKNGEGFDLVVLPGVALSGRIVCTKRKNSEA